MEKYIAVTKETREFLQKAFKTTKMSVWRALYFDKRAGDTPLARRIRKAARERGGVLMIAGNYMETLHDSDNYMRQYFPNGVMLEWEKTTDHVELIKDGEVAASFDNVEWQRFSEIQRIAERM